MHECIEQGQQKGHARCSSSNQSLQFDTINPQGVWNPQQQHPCLNKIIVGNQLSTAWYRCLSEIGWCYSAMQQVICACSAADELRPAQCSKPCTCVSTCTATLLQSQQAVQRTAVQTAKRTCSTTDDMRLDRPIV